MTVYQALPVLQKELKAPKNQFNSFGNYNYRNQEDILEALKPLLSKHGLVLTITDELVLVGDRYYIKATCHLRDATGNKLETTAYAREADIKKGMDVSQITGSTSSYARKYALNGMFLCDDTKDADSHENKEEPPPPKPPASIKLSDVSYKGMLKAIEEGNWAIVEKKMKNYDIDIERYDNLINLIKEAKERK